MKSLTKIFGVLLAALMLSSCAPSIISAQNNGQYISDQEFYDQLSPYGTWVNDPQYGTVWVPEVDGDFRPYATNGHWVLTEYGNTWVSDYEWGWAAFHYGRWHLDDYYGWEWIPGNEWAPAWVSWRSGDSYYGWAPLGPEINYEASFSDNYTIPDNYWVFTSQAYINQPNVYNHYVPYSNVPAIIRRTSYVRNTYVYNNRRYYSGPRREDIQRYSKSPVRVYDIRNINRPGAVRVNNNSVNIYRPGVRQNTNARPSRVVDGAAYKQQNPTWRIGSSDRRNGTGYNRDNASRLANTARNTTADNKVVRVNRPARVGVINPANIPAAVNPATGVNRPTDNVDAGRNRRPAVTGSPETQQQQAREQQRQQMQRAREQRQPQEQQRQQQQLSDQQRQQQQQAREQQRQQRQQAREQRQPQEQPNANDVQRQQQAREQQRQQQQQAREQARQQQEQQRQQQQQARDQQSQQQEQQRQQQEQQRQQQQQARDQQRQQQRQQQEQQRQQQQQARDQQRQQQEQQRQQSRQRPARP